VDVDAVADELYTLPPGEFVASRDEKVREAKEAGDRDAARAIAALRRPTVVAWLANLLARRHPDDVAPFLELGEALRDATATLSGPELRDLSRQRHQLVHALVRTARALGEAEGQRVGEDSARGLEDTLHAALADPDAAQQLLDGRLTTGLSRAGFGDPTAASAAGGGSPSPAKKARKRTASQAGADEDERRAAWRSRIERDLGEAWGEARRTAEARDAAEDAARAAEKHRAEAARDVRRLRDDLQRAERSLAEAESDGEAATRERDRAEKEADRARQRVTDLQARLDEV
jgi:hypothetical protein